MKFQFVCFLSILVNFSCSDSPRPTKPVQNKTENKYPAEKPPSNFLDTLTINFPAAVFYSPDSLQLENIKSISNARMFDGSMHEYYYLMRNARSVIKRYFPQLKIIEPKNVRYLLFIGADKEKNVIDLNSKNDAYGLLVFDKKKSPQLLDMANIESELGFYFSK